MKKWRDPIVEEVRRTRDKLAAKFNYDIDAIFADIRSRQGNLPGLVKRKAKRKPPKSRR